MAASDATPPGIATAIEATPAAFAKRLILPEFVAFFDLPRGPAAFLLPIGAPITLFLSSATEQLFRYSTPAGQVPALASLLT